MRYTRDQWIKTALPAILTAIVYIWTYGRGLQADVNRIGNQIGHAQAARPAPESITVAHADLLQLQQELANKTRPAAAKNPHAPAVQVVPPAEGLQAVTAILARNRLLVVSTKSAEKAGGPSWQGGGGDLSQRIAARRNGTAPVLWSVEMIGSYPQVQEALSEIARSNLCVVPQDIAMEPLAADVPTAQWTLWIWL